MADINEKLIQLNNELIEVEKNLLKIGDRLAQESGMDREIIIAKNAISQLKTEISKVSHESELSHIIEQLDLIKSKANEIHGVTAPFAVESLKTKEEGRSDESIKSRLSENIEQLKAMTMEGK